MFLNNIKPADGSTKASKRLGRGIGSGSGKTGGRGHKGQKSRSGGYHKVGFEGGQQPFQRRQPKFGFTSLKGLVTAEIRLHELDKVNAEVVDLDALKAANLISKNIKFAKVVFSGEITKAVILKGIKATASAKAAIEKVGGKVEA